MARSRKHSVHKHMDSVVFLPNVCVEEKDEANNQKLLKNGKKRKLKLELSFSPPRRLHCKYGEHT